MGTPEDVAAEKYFTPPNNLTDMLRKNMYMEPTCDSEHEAIEDALATIKDTVKEWLREVAIGGETTDTLRMRRDLITLVDEP